MGFGNVGRAAVVAALWPLWVAAADRVTEADMAPPLSYHEAVARTLAESPTLKVFPLRREAQSARMEMAAQRPAPVVSVDLENALGSGERRGVTSAETTLALSQVIELGGQSQRRRESARIGRDLIDIEYAVAQLDQVAEVGRRFIHAAADEHKLKLAYSATALAEQTVREVDRQAAAGRVPAAERSRAQIALARVRIEAEHAEHERLASRRRLAAMWGGRDKDFGTVTAALLTLPTVPSEHALITRLAESADVLRFVTRAQQQTARGQVAEGRARGEVRVSTGLRRFELTDDMAWVAGVSVPLFSRRREQPAIAEAHAMHEQVANERAAFRVEAEATLFTLLQELQHSITEANALQDTMLPQMEVALADTEAAWKAGRYSYLEWTLAQRELIELRRSLIEACAEAHRLRLEIERLAGTPLDLMDDAPDIDRRPSIPAPMSAKPISQD